jgi:hypothetical protein
MKPTTFTPPTRPKRTKHLRVPVFPDEEQQIVNYAESTGLSVAAYLRNLGMGYKPTSVLDAQIVEDLAKINAAQSRLGNLVQLALSNPEKQGLYGDIGVARELRRLTIAINQLQEEMLEIVEKIKF